MVDVVKEIHDSDYSECLEGPELIVRCWEHKGSLSEQSARRHSHWHQHLRGQLLCIDSGLIQVRTGQGSWILPPQRAGWIPPGAMHSVHFASHLSGRSLLFRPELCDLLPDIPCVISISEVLGALMLRASGWEKSMPLIPEQKRIVDVILDEIRLSPHESLHLPIPQDRRLECITRAVLKEPGSARTVEQWATIGAVSARTLRRLMLSETGMSFSQWRQQARLAHALEMLSRGVSVTEVSEACGYASPANFIAMFRRVFADSPAHYLACRTKK
ncbi:AraC family transcriptional regulator [Oceanospirillum sediminis]|uniref:Helix-turn-helix transcriptional regulator n=1 Tax=Oceanospirillum sediminis TaxID=2760088 RepID=A0A839IUG0_9GAMM|nr:helix-turn-helix transcriptional regulator [Oceanospirillum sediminis]MBB1487756.1 helix-turn-helix transcriptional regulator [Oceanospirillum sediminis]